MQVGLDIDSYLDNATKDKDLRLKVIRIHDNLLTAHKIIESVVNAANLLTNPSDDVLLAVFETLENDTK